MTFPTEITFGCCEVKFILGRTMSMVSSKYSLWKKSIANAYKISQMLSSVQGETMSSHESDGIHSVVVYGNGAKLYVNYSSSEWTVDEKNVSAGGFLFVDSNGTKTEKWGSEK